MSTVAPKRQRSSAVWEFPQSVAHELKPAVARLTGLSAVLGSQSVYVVSFRTYGRCIRYTWR